MSLLQIRSRHFSQGLLSPDILLVNRPSGGLLLRLSRPSMVCDDDESNHTVLTNRQPFSNKDTDTQRNISFLPTGSTVVVQQEDGGSWMQRMIIGHGSEDQTGDATR